MQSGQWCQSLTGGTRDRITTGAAYDKWDASHCSVSNSRQKNGPKLENYIHIRDILYNRVGAIICIYKYSITVYSIQSEKFENHAALWSIFAIYNCTLCLRIDH